MKVLVLTVLTLISSTAFADKETVLSCQSKDFNASTNTGESLTVTLNGVIVTEVHKDKGSWYSENITTTNPVKLSTTDAITVYTLNFQDDSFSQQLVVPNTSSPTWMKYSFRDSDQPNRQTFLLDCSLSKKH